AGSAGAPRGGLLPCPAAPARGALRCGVARADAAGRRGPPAAAVESAAAGGAERCALPELRADQRLPAAGGGRAGAAARAAGRTLSPVEPAHCGGVRMHELLNVLYVQTQGAMLHLDHETVRVEVERETRLRAPLLRLGGIVVFGQVLLSPFLIARCAADGRSLVWLNRHGRFQARVEGPVRGNVLLRRAQHLAVSDRARSAAIARQIVPGKVQNSRQMLLRAARDAVDPAAAGALAAAAAQLADVLSRLRNERDLDRLRG